MYVVQQRIPTGFLKAFFQRRELPLTGVTFWIYNTSFAKYVFSQCDVTRSVLASGYTLF